eukprot:TRINITY_DN5004_c0_g1_i1.p1 TRINITY_DN5004_c0_g1~~TRINITY_DN5004_c0_g1_i1.p1  ORF type:complete len:853 (+),score=177.76 TRINITY_DN5004_c0_g1_i1:224-2560(+)
MAKSQQEKDGISAKSIKAEKVGQIRSLHFYDQHTRACKDIFALDPSRRATTPITSLPTQLSSSTLGRRSRDTSSLSEGNTDVAGAGDVDDDDDILAGVLDAWFNGIIIITEYRIIFLDYITFATAEIRLASSFEGKLVTNVYALPFSPCFVSFACNDGVVRIWNTHTWQLHTTIAAPRNSNQSSSSSSSSKVAPISDILAYYDHDLAEQYATPSASSTSSSLPSSSSSNTIPKGLCLITAASDGTVCDWDLASGTMRQEGPKSMPGDMTSFAYDPISGHVMFACSDRVIVVWDVFQRIEILRKSTGKLLPDPALLFIHPSYEKRIMLCGKEPSQVILLDDSKETKKEDGQVLFDLAELIPKKEKIKITCLTPHPLHHDTIACSTNRGIAMVNIAGPHASPNLSVGRGPSSFLAYYLRNGGLHYADLLYASSTKQDPRVGTLKSVTPPTSGSGIKLVTVSPSGNLVATVYSDSKYQILSTSGQVLQQGNGSSVVWSTNDSRFATIETIQQQQAPATVAKSLLSKSKTKGKLTNTPTYSTSLRIHHANDDSNIATASALEVNTPLSVSSIVGGVLLGVYFMPEEPSVPPLLSSRTPSSKSLTSSSSSSSLSSSTSSLHPSSSPSSLSSSTPVSPQHHPSPLSVSTPIPSPSPSSTSTLSSSSPSSTPPSVPSPYLATAAADGSTTPSSLSSHIDHRTFQFYDWEKGDAVGSRMPAPSHVIWDDDGGDGDDAGDVLFCVLAFPSYFSVFALRPTFHLIAKYPITILSGIFYKHTFFYDLGR